MAIVGEKLFKYPAEDECLVRRLGSGVMAAWPSLSEETRALVLHEAAAAWDREFQVSKLPEKLDGMVRRYRR